MTDISQMIKEMECWKKAVLESYTEDQIDSMGFNDGVGDVVLFEGEADLDTINERYNALMSGPTPAESGNQKLLDLGLTQEEIHALTGFRPQE